jgi:hypothetical protein
VDLGKLKEVNRIEDLIEEDGYRLDRKPDQRYWLCLQDPGLKVDVERQRYYWETHDESGDVINWLVNRFNWTVGEAIKYLKNRLTIPADLRPSFPIKEQPDQPGEVITKGAKPAEPEVVVAPELVKDKRVQKVQRLAYDYPRGIEKILNLNYLQVYEEQRWIPKLFIELSGQIDEASECCDYCFCDLTGWKKGDVFLAISVNGNYEIIPSDTTWRGIYCRQCVFSFKRWMEALELLAKVKGEIWYTGRKACDGRAGGNHTT